MVEFTFKLTLTILWVLFVTIDVKYIHLWLVKLGVGEQINESVIASEHTYSFTRRFDCCIYIHNKYIMDPNMYHAKIASLNILYFTNGKNDNTLWQLFDCGILPRIQA